MEFQIYQDTHVVWKPGKNNGQRIKKFKKIIEDKYKIKLNDYWELHRWSVEHINEFWSELWDFFEVISSKKFTKAIDLSVPMKELPEWFPGAELNLAENLLKYRDNKVALIVTGEGRKTEKVTYLQMYEEVRLYAAAFRKIGLTKGDIVACQMSNRKEAVFAMLATASIGAVWGGALPLLGVEAVLNRFQQVKPKVFFTVDCFPYDGKEYETLGKLKDIAEGLPTLEKVIIVASQPSSYLKDISGIRNSCFLDDFLKAAFCKDQTVPELIFEQVSFSHPVFVSFTSGTTGMPKTIVHGFSGVLSTSRDFGIHFDSDRHSSWFSLSPVGWISWNIFNYILSLGGTILLFEGLPYFITPTFFWDLIDEQQISHLVIASSILDEFQKRNYLPGHKDSLKSLKMIVCGGSVVKPQTYDFVYKDIKKDIIFASTYGFTEAMGGLIGLETSVPIHRGELPAFYLGLIFQTMDETGKPVEGEVGELVVPIPMPNLPLGIWGDKDGSMYREEYFSKYKDKFAVGDYAIINPVTKGTIICCRCDETLKQRGCRFGSSEIYNVVEKFPEIRDSLCVSHYNKQMDERAVLFLKIREGYEYSDQLVTKIRSAITEELTNRHVPDIIIETKDIPYNINGKKLEIIVKKIINQIPCSTDTIKNPDSLEYYRNVPDLQWC